MPRYCLITPCRDEAEYARQSLDSVVAQSAPPAKWIIVDDGSTDGTSEILAEYAGRHDFIQVVPKPDRGSRAVGPGVIEAFYAGLEHVELAEFDYLCKLDLDLDLPPRYFEGLMDKMAAEPRLGTCSGKPYFFQDGKLVSEAIGDEMSAGMTKFYRTACFEEIGGFVREVMWDGIDCHLCRMQDWLAQSFDDEQLRFIHLRVMGSSQGKGILQGRMRHGFGQYFMGTGIVYMAVSAVFRMSRPPLLLGGMAMFWGYLKSMLLRRRRYENPGFRRFLRSYQWNALFRGKAGATAALHEAIRARHPAAEGATPQR